MSTSSLEQPIAVVPRPGMRVAAVALGLGLLAFGLIFHEEIVAAVTVWFGSTAYNHCFLVLPIAAYLLWDRRDTLQGLTLRPEPLLTLLGIPLAAAWLAAERLGIMEGRQLVALSFVQLLFLSVLGRRAWWAMSGPLLYLYFLVPFGAFLVPQLQDFTTGFVQHGLALLHIPAYITGNTIEIPEGTFFVAEACAGLRFLIASVAFGVLYALLMYRSYPRRFLFLVVSIVVPIIANGFRALGIVALGHFLGSARAAATDHILYGWIFFSIVTLLLIVLGLPFRQDHRGPADDRRRSVFNPMEPGVARGVAIVAVVLCVLAAASPALALGLNHAGRSARQRVPVVDFGPGCTRLLNTGDSSAVPVQRVRCNGLDLLIRTRMLPPHSTAAPVFAAEASMIDATGVEDYEVHWLPASPGQQTIWRLVSSMSPPSLMAVAMWIDGKPSAPSLAERLHLAWSSVLGARTPPVVVAVEAVVDWSKLSPFQRHWTEDQLVQLLRDRSHVTWTVLRPAKGGSQ